MLRPEQMSRVSVTGSKQAMDDVIETVHDLGLLHLTEYDGSWDGFQTGNPIEGADEASDKLVTVRSLQSILGVDDGDAGPTRLVTDEALDDELEDIRQEVNELDDRRNDLEDDLRAVEERIDMLDPFVTLGIDLDLLGGYEELAVAVGVGDSDSVASALDAADVESYELFVEDDVVAVFARTDDDAIDDALVGATFTGLELPTVDDDLVDVDEERIDPQEYRSKLDHRKQQLENKLETVESELEDLRLDVSGFLLAAEEKLTIEVQKNEAPLAFATTDNAYVAEGWIPTEQYDEFEAALTDAVGDHVDVAELERVAYGRHGTPQTSESVDDGTSETDAPATADADGPTAAAADEGESEQPEARADGGGADGSNDDVVTMTDEGPPVIQNNPGLVEPFELLTRAVGRPNYSELDPTVVIFLTLPLMFGFMIGDVGYGLIYTGIGYYLYWNYESGAFRDIGIVAIWAGLFTAAFGFVFGEIFGLHLVTEYVWDPLIGGAPLHKGLAPNHAVWALAWFIVIALFGVLHLNVAYLFEFHENYTLHGLKDAVIESGSWLLAMNGFWLFVLSTMASGPKPDFIYYAFDKTTEQHRAAIELGFSGLPPEVGMLGLVMVAAGFVLLAIGPAYELIEFHLIMAHPLSYLRIGAELVAEVGLAFTVNLLFWGGYATETEHGEAWHFALGHLPHVGEMAHGHEVTQILFPGLAHMGLAAAVFGVVVLVVGNLIVLVLGVMSVGIQAIRLEYFEFFEKFYDGGGVSYNPFGTERVYTAED
ncbi:MAG: V-type ATP synthase subunit I [Haloarculaceae archaeon]